MGKEVQMIPANEEFQIYQVMAKKASESKFFANMGGEGAILSIMLMARELGLAPMQSVMGGMNIIQGKVEISPRMMNTMIRRAGHTLKIIKNDDQICTIQGIRNDTKEDYTAHFTIEDARRAGLIRNGGGWEKYPSDMLFARCISRLARRLFADVISTAYVEGEIEEGDEKAEEAVVVEQPPEVITAEEAQAIELCFEKEDAEFRQRMLDSCSKEYKISMVDFTNLPKKGLDPVLASIKRRAAKKQKKLQAPIVIEQADVEMGEVL